MKFADDTGAVGPGVANLQFAKTVKLPADSLAVVNREMSVQDFVAEFRKAQVLRELPGDVLEGSVADALRAGDSTVRKPLVDGRWAK